jgi:ABC-type uncharacterized transport system YnjBCD ATPase subunit
MQTTRRGMLIGTAATALTATGQLSASSPSLAAAPSAGKQAPGVYRHKLGDLELTQISDGNVTFPLADGFVTNADKAAVNAALEAAFLPRDTFSIRWWSTTVRSWFSSTPATARQGPRPRASS